jgi:hypothetical protein
MNRISKLLVSLFVCALAAQTAFAGVPIKGVDVKLGKNPGGSVAARASGESGEANFGVLPQGSYTVTFNATNLAADARTAKVNKLHVEISGGAQGAIKHVLPAATAETLEPIEVLSDGKTPLVVHVSDGGSEPVDWARVKSHSNTNNN